MYSTVSDVCNSLGVEGIDSREAAIITSLINTADSIVNKVCGVLTFEQEYNYEELCGENCTYLFPKGRNISNFIFSGIDRGELISVQVTGADSISLGFENKTIEVVLGYTSYTSSFDYDDTLEDVVTYLNTISGITAALINSNVADVPAWVLYNQYEFYTVAGTESPILYLEGATSRITLKKVSEGFFIADREIEYDDTVKLIYKSGYSTIPDAIKTASTIAASMLYRSLKNDVSLASERIGDYSYNTRSNQEVVSSIESTIRPILTKYNRKDL